MSKVLEEHGYNVYSTDLIDRGYGIGGVDFLQVNEKWNGDILTNPPYKCFSFDTECYTKNGWKKYDQLSYEDAILSCNSETQELEWSKIKQIIIRPFDKENEKMYHFKKRRMDIMCTNKHRMYAFCNGELLKKNGDLIYSEDIRKKHYIPRYGYKWNGERKEFFVLPQIFGCVYAQPTLKEEVLIPMDNWLKFFGLWIADGYCRHTNNSQGNKRKTVGIKQAKITADYIRKVLRDLPFDIIRSITIKIRINKYL